MPSANKRANEKWSILMNHPLGVCEHTNWNWWIGQTPVTLCSQLRRWRGGRKKLWLFIFSIRLLTLTNTANRRLTCRTRSDLANDYCWWPGFKNQLNRSQTPRKHCTRYLKKKIAFWSPSVGSGRWERILGSPPFFFKWWLRAKRDFKKNHFNVSFNLL